ncbi:conserved hypothetical protein [Candidatus Sulfopaludibacter sp. SbA6]|nr:conserved hypothetical protein [Candidatus Sulfopaludibacter sp. SbA6]
MHVNLVPFIVLWALLAASVLVLIVWRKMVANNEDDTLHVLQGSVAQQVTVAQKLEVIDKWGKILTVITLVFGLILGAAYVYQNFVQLSNIQGA